MNWKTLLLILFALFIPICLANSLPYWIENDSGNLTIWTKVNISAEGAICLYIVKNPGYAPDGDAVFEFFDDFDGTALNTSKWVIASGSPSVSNSSLHLEGGVIYTKDFKMPESFIFECRYEQPTKYGYATPVVFYGTDIDSYANVIFKHSGTYGYIQLYQRAGSSEYNEVSKNTPVNIGQWYKTITIVRPDGTITNYLGNISVSSHYNFTLVGYNYPMYLYMTSADFLCDYVFVGKCADQDPIVSVEHVSNTTLTVKITNPNSYDLTNFQVEIPATGFVSTINESLMIEPVPIAQVEYYKSIGGYTLTVSGDLGNVSLYLGSALLYSGVITSDHPFQTTFSYDVSAYSLSIVYHDYGNASVPYKISQITQGTYNLTLVPVGNYTNETFYPMIITVAGKSYWIANYTNIPMNVSVSTYENSPILITSSLGQEISVPAMNQKVPIYFTTSWSSIKASTTPGHVLKFETQNDYIVGYGQIINIKIPTGLTLTPYLDGFKLTPFTVSQDLNLFYSPTDLLPQIYVYQTINGDILISIKSLQPHNFTALFYQNNTIVKNISLLPGTFIYPDYNYTKIVIYVDGKNYTTMELYPTNPLKDWDTLDFPEKVLLSMFLLSIVGIIYLVSGITMVLAAGIVIPILILLPLPTSLIGFISAFLLLSALFYLYKRRM